MNNNLISKTLAETGSCFEQMFKPVIKTGSWQIAVLRQCGKVFPDCVQQVERHNNTDEIFILTAGKADLIVIEEKAGKMIPHIIQMGINVVYNIKKSVWHHVLLSQDAHIFLFEKADTSRDNSDYLNLDESIQEEIRKKKSV